VWERIERRRALLIAPFAFAGLVAVSSRRGEEAVEAGGAVELMEFGPDGRPLGARLLDRVVLSQSEWRARLSPQAYYVLRHGSTDAPHAHAFDASRGEGLYRCAGCGNALFLSSDEYNSGTGWPSFRAPADSRNVRARTDVSMMLERTEVSCARCGGHLGHVFPDGPAPHGLRYCINGSALR
jgi:peptide-methionine (R)-S-oxide reductase